MLDKATASLDSKLEHVLQETLSKFMRERTTFVIVHRLLWILIKLYL